jgi:hypothetical protein
MIIAIIIREMTRKGRKFEAQALKKREPVNLPALPLRESKIPPERNAEIKIPKKTTRKNTEGKASTMLPKPSLIRSPSAAISGPSASRSVIMLFPKPAFRKFFRGKAAIETSRREVNHKSKMPFQTFNVRQKPEARALNILIII